VKYKVILYIVFLSSFFLFSSTLSAETWEAAIPSPGKSSRARKKIADHVLTLWKARFKLVKRTAEFKKKSPTRIEINFSKKVGHDLVRNLLTTPGRLEIREIVNDVGIFSELTHLEFKKHNSKGIESVCFETRNEVDRALSALIGPDFHFGVFRRDPQEKSNHPWCVVALGSKVLRNNDVQKIKRKRSLKGDFSLLFKMKIKSIDRLAENGELTVKSLAITIDGDIVARTTFQQMKRLPISIRPPSWVDAKEWTTLVRVLMLKPILVPVVLLEPK